MREFMRFNNEHCEEEFYLENGEYGLVTVTYDKEKFISECENFSSNIVNYLDENNQVVIDLDTYRSHGDGSFECNIKNSEKNIEVEGDEDYILEIKSV